MNNPTGVRPSPIAGQWYPGDPFQLARSVDRYLDSARLPEIEGRVLGVIAPHAGHRYSGAVAGHAFAALRGREPELVAVVAPMHHPYTEPVLTSAHRAYATPLGEIPIDSGAIALANEILQEELGTGLSPVAGDPEHALEIELPFLQRALGGKFGLLPVMLRDQSPRVAQALGRALAHALQGREALLVASSDLSHFYKQADAETFDSEMLRRMAAFDPEGVLAAEGEGQAFACGRGAIAAVLWAARAQGADRVQVLHYATSGDVTGDYSSVVGYGAAAVVRTSGGPS
jgi:AmmeMemoRadiSam system protein B